MRIVTWNVNGIRSVEKHGFINWLQKETPDILCLNETKAEPGQLSQSLVNPDVKGVRYSTYWASAKKKGYSGAAIFTREKPLDVRFLGNNEFDDEGRVLIAEYENFTLITAYFPNSQDGGKRLSYKLAFNDEILKLCNSIVKKDRHFILSGDFNVAHTPIDLARPKQNVNNPGFLPQERAWMDKYTAAGHVDTFRHFHLGETGHYTWWSYMGKSREKNVGWRIDYNCVDKNSLSLVKSSIIKKDVLGSDHCPIEIEIDI